MFIQSVAVTLLISMIASVATAASAPMSLGQIALYQGADRQKILVEGAKKEGQLVLYDSHTWFKTYVKEFEKKYPFITVSEWRSDSKNILTRAMTEFSSSRSIADVIETTAEGMWVMKRDGMFQEYYSPRRGITRTRSNQRAARGSTISAIAKPTTAWASTRP